MSDELTTKLAESLREIVAAADGTGWNQIDAGFSKAREALRLYEQAKAQPVQDLPPLPIEWRKVEDADGVEVPVFRAFQMRDYAREAMTSYTQAQAEPVCTCPSGDGSLRWPCPAHPPAPARCANGPMGCDYPRCDCNGASTKESNQ